MVIDNTFILFIGILLSALLFVLWLFTKRDTKTTHVDISVGTPVPKSPDDTRSTAQQNAGKTAHVWGSTTDPTKL